MTARFYAPTFEVRISGLTLSADISKEVISLQVDNNLDLADMFTLVLRNADNQMIDSALFDLGKTVEVHIGYGSELQPMMLGEISSIEPSFPESGTPTLRICGYDLSHRLRNGQGDRQFQYVPDSVVAAVIAAEAGLIPVVDPSPFFHRKKIIQSGSDMAFLKDRARANFFDVYVHWDKLYFQFPRPQLEAVVLEWGKNLGSFTPRLSNSGLAGMQVVRGYNEELAQSIVAFAMAPDLDLDNLLERLGSSARDMLLKLGKNVVRNQPVESPIDAALLAKSILQDILEGLYEGSGSCVGLPELKAGQMIEVRGVGKRFSGMYRLRKVTHTIGDSGYRTSFEVTQRGGAVLLSLLRKSITERPSPDSRERFYGVAVAKVEANHVDASEGPPLARVKVSYPWLSDKVESGWARCASPMTGSGTGLFLLPEIGDEVLVAFEHGDLAKPIVLSSLWNGKRLPPVSNVDGANHVRVLKTAAGHEIRLDDTPVTGQLSLKDMGGSEIVLKADGSVSITAKTSMTLKAATTISLEAASVNVKVTSSMNIS
ncbi:phage baseplate assembly protein V [Burkholderiaceae bacterium UC74_6]